MGVAGEPCPLNKDSFMRNLFLTPKRPVHSDTQKQKDKDLNDRIAKRLLFERIKRNYNLSVVSKSSSIASSLENASAEIDQRMQLIGPAKNTSFFLGPKVPSSPEDRQVFATPKRYLCEGCNAKLFNVSAYVKHLRKHKISIRCSGCDRICNDVLSKRRHELRCPKKLKLRF